LQPLDVSINRIFKQEMKNRFSNLMIESDEMVSRNEINQKLIEWVDAIWNGIE